MIMMDGKAGSIPFDLHRILLNDLYMISFRI